MALSFDAPNPAASLVSTMAGGLVGSEILRIAADVRALKANGREILDLTVGDFSPSQFRIPAVLEQRITEALKKGETNYPPSNGMPQLREAVARLFQRELGLDYPVSGVLVAGGARPLIYGTYRTLVDPGDVVVYPVPSWNNNHYIHMLGARGVAVVARPENRFLPTADDLRPHMRDARLLTLCSPQNPTGTAFTADELGAICDLVLAENRRRGPNGRPVYVMYDQVYWTLTFGATKHVNPVSLRPEMAPYTVFVDGASKAFAATGLRVGFGVGPPAVMQRMSDVLGHVGAWAPRAEQLATAALLDDQPALDAFRATFRAGVAARLDALHAGLRHMAAEGLPVSAIEPMGALYLTMRVAVQGRRTPAGRVLNTNDDIRKELLEQAGIAIVPFQSFAYPGDTGWFRCSVGFVSAADITQALPRMAATLRTLT